jgi:hypothetical protein
MHVMANRLMAAIFNVRRDFGLLITSASHQNPDNCKKQDSSEESSMEDDQQKR